MKFFIEVKPIDCANVSDAAEAVTDAAKKIGARCGMYFGAYLMLANPDDVAADVEHDYHRWASAPLNGFPIKRYAGR